MSKYHFIILFNLIIFSSCYKDDEDVIARVGSEKLLLSVVKESIPKNIDDSLYHATKIVNDWVRNKLLLSNAEMNLSSNMNKYDIQVEKFRESLLIYEYQQQLLNQNIDTIINHEEIINYFNQYKLKFMLQQNIFKGRFIKIENNAPNIEIIEKLYSSNEEEEISALENYCQQFAKEYYLNDNIWQYFSIFSKDLTTFIENEILFFKKNKKKIFKDENYTYYIFINEYKTKGSFSPLSLEKARIKDILLNKKKVTYLKNLEDELYKNALANKKIKIY